MELPIHFYVFTITVFESYKQSMNYVYGLLLILEFGHIHTSNSHNIYKYFIQLLYTTTTTIYNYYTIIIFITQNSKR